MVRTLRDCTCIKTCVEVLLDYNNTIQSICTLLTTFYFVLRDNWYLWKYINKGTKILWVFILHSFIHQRIMDKIIIIGCVRWSIYKRNSNFEPFFRYLRKTYVIPVSPWGESGLSQVISIFQNRSEHEKLRGIK